MKQSPNKSSSGSEISKEAREAANKMEAAFHCDARDVKRFSEIIQAAIDKALSVKSEQADSANAGSTDAVHSIATAETGLLPCPWCGAVTDAEDEWGSLITHKPDCYWENILGDSIGRVRVNNSQKARWNQRVPQIQGVGHNANVGGVSEEARHKIVTALEASTKLNTGQGCPDENLSVVVLAGDALDALHESSVLSAPTQPELALELRDARELIADLERKLADAENVIRVKDDAKTEQHIATVSAPTEEENWKYCPNCAFNWQHSPTDQTRCPKCGHSLKPNACGDNPASVETATLRGLEAAREALEYVVETYEVKCKHPWTSERDNPSDEICTKCKIDAALARIDSLTCSLSTKPQAPVLTPKGEEPASPLVSGEPLGKEAWTCLNTVLQDWQRESLGSHYVTIRRALTPSPTDADTQVEEKS